MRSSVSLLVLATGLALCPTVSAQEGDAGSSAAARLRVPLDVRLVAPPIALHLEPLQDSTTVADTARGGNYALAGGVLGALVGTIMVGSAARGIGDDGAGGAYVYGALLGGLPGFVIGSLIGSGIEKPTYDSNDEADAPADTASATRGSRRAGPVSIRAARRCSGFQAADRRWRGSRAFRRAR